MGHFGHLRGVFLFALHASAIITLPLQEYVTLFDSGVGGHHRLHVTEYYGRVSFGNPPQEFDMVFDTGSGNIVLPTAKCSDEACQSHRRFVSKDSTTAAQLAYDDGTPMQPGDSDRDTTTITYGTGKLTGEYVRDTCCLGGASSTGTPQLCIPVDFLGVVQESRFPFVELPFDGIFGLGLVGLSAGQNFNFVSNLRSSDAVTDPTFAVFLRHLDADEDSEITFGGYQASRLLKPDGGMAWLPVPKEEADGKGYWLVSMRDVYVNGEPLGICDDFSAAPRCKAAMDTGSSLMMGPSFAMEKLLQAIGGCSQEMPTLRFVFDAVAGGSFDMVLRPEDYAEWTGESCATGFQAIELPPSLGQMWVIGQTALRKYYTVYDPKRWRVGIGEARHSTAKRGEDTSTGAPTVMAQHNASALEACLDDDADMASSHLPGCKSFASMNYCTRFPPLANHYCPRSCGLCKQASAPASRASAASPAHGSTPVLRASALNAARRAGIRPHAASATSFLRGAARGSQETTSEVRVREGFGVESHKRRQLLGRSSFDRGIGL